MATKTSASNPYQTTELSEEEVLAASKVIAKDKQRKERKKEDSLVFGGKRYWKVLIVKFRTERDVDDFAKKIGQTITAAHKAVVFNEADAKRGHGGLHGGLSTKKTAQSDIDPHWQGMPEFTQEASKWDRFRLKVYFASLEDYRQFAHLVRQFLKKTTTSVHYPEWTPSKLKNQRWVSSLPDSEKNPRYPIYIVSKGRGHSRLTAKTLAAMNVPYFIVVEPSEFETYASVEGRDRLLMLSSDTDPTAPTGPGRARNFCRDHAWTNGYRRHWVMDDNIAGFFRLHRNKRLRVGDGAIFRAAEDFVDRYENIVVAGLQYRHFCASKSKYPPYVKNTRIYSCLLIDNTLLFRWKNGERQAPDEVPVVVNAKPREPMGEDSFFWRERYNEDTILSLDAMENGFATVQFNAFLQGKSGTQQLKGGNTAEFYAVEDAEIEGADELARYNEAGTLRKSLLLQKVYPSVTKLVYTFSRPHHYVDYSRYEQIPLLLKRDIAIPTEPNDYGMQLLVE